MGREPPPSSPSEPLCKQTHTTGKKCGRALVPAPSSLGEGKEEEGGAGRGVFSTCALHAGWEGGCSGPAKKGSVPMTLSDLQLPVERTMPPPITLSGGDGEGGSKKGGDVPPGAISF